jgi:hypothetical protein
VGIPLKIKILREKLRFKHTQTHTNTHNIPRSTKKKNFFVLFFNLIKIESKQKKYKNKFRPFGIKIKYIFLIKIYLSYQYATYFLKFLIEY